MQNAKITSTYLGIEDHGLLTLWLNLDYGGSGQGFGGYALDTRNEHSKRRIGTAFGTDLILQILNTLKVDSWEKLPGTPCRVECTLSKVYAIGHFIEDKWLNIDVLFQEHEELLHE